LKRSTAGEAAESSEIEKRRQLMLHLMVSGDDARYVWRLVRLTSYGADIVAGSSTAHPTEASCRADVEALLRAPLENLIVTRHSDGHWRWVVLDSAGSALAESPPVFRDASQCADAFEELRTQLGAHQYW
jgi:hypothetical protein